MQTLAKYLFGLLLFLLASLNNEEPVKEEIVEQCSQVTSEQGYACEPNKEIISYI